MRKKILIACFPPLLLFGFVALSASEMGRRDAFPPKTDFFPLSLQDSIPTHYDFPRARIWGWSNNGKFAYSLEREIGGRGGQKIDFVVFDLISDNIVFELKMDSFDHNGVTDEALYNLFMNDISNALKTHNIADKRTEFLRFPIRKNNVEYDSRVINVERKKHQDWRDGIVSKYAISVTANNKKKTIGAFSPVHTVTMDVYVSGYILSPFENRALVVAAEEHMGFEGAELTYRFSGCHLGAGFN